MTVIHKTTLHLPKIAYTARNRGNAVDLELEIREETGTKQTVDLETVDSYHELSIVGAIWNRPHTDWACGGQIVDTIRQNFRSRRVRKICEIWERWHLNGMNAGTREQRNAAKVWTDKTGRYDYSEVCKHLESVDLLEDRGYRYGSAWLVEPLPLEIENEIKELFRSDPQTSEAEDRVKHELEV